MNKFDLAEEMAIANMINALNSKYFVTLFNDEQRMKIMETIKNHISESVIKMNSPLTNNITATPTAEDKAKLPVNDAARLWGEETESYTQHL